MHVAGAAPRAATAASQHRAATLSRSLLALHLIRSSTAHLLSSAPLQRRTDRCEGAAGTFRTLVQAPAGSAGPSSINDGFTYFQLELPPPVNSRVKKSEFVKSSIRVADCPPDKHPEFAVIGRSNVGKSSLINSLAENKGLARISKSPGQTKLINHYLMNDSWYLVDLPGYGYAKANKADRDEWIKFTKDFFIKRDSLVHVLLLVDGSLPPQRIDIDCAQWLADCQVPFCIVFTKVDATKKDMPTSAANVRTFKSMLAEDWEELPWCFETSAKTGVGKSELLGYLASLRGMARHG